jgi:hypothetical protein
MGPCFYLVGLVPLIANVGRYLEEGSTRDESFYNDYVVKYINNHNCMGTALDIWESIPIVS